MILHFDQIIFFLSDPGIPGVRSMGPVLCNSLYLCEVMQVMQVIQVMQFMQVIQVIQVMQVMQVIQVIQVIESIQRRQPFLVAPSGGQICNSCKWCHMVANFATNASGAI